MSNPVITVTPETSAKHAATLLTAHGFTALPVVDDDDRLVGIVTEADLIRNRTPHDPRTRFKRNYRGPEVVAEQTVGAVMSSPAIGMSSGTDVAELAAVLLEAKIRAIPIVDGATVIGIVTRRDIIDAFARDDHAIATDVRHRLEIYGGPGRWTVHVRDGVVTIEDKFASETDQHVATLLAEAVPGVVHARTMNRVEGSDVHS